MPVQFPDGLRLERLTKSHKRKAFDSGELEVNAWLQSHARQSQEKHLSITQVLVSPKGDIAGFFTLAMGQVNFEDLPEKIAKKLPRTALPIITLAWLGVDKRFQGQGLGRRLLAQSLSHALGVREKIPFVAVVIDCLNHDAKRFYVQFDFEELPGHPMKLFISSSKLEAIAKG